MKWQKKLTKKEMNHLKDTHNGPPTLAGLKRNREWQKGEGTECYECRHIALKLGVEE